MRFNYRHSSPLRYRTGTSQLARFIHLPVLVPTFLPHQLSHLGNVLVQDCAARLGPRKITQVFKYRYRSGFRIFREDHNFARPRAPNRFEVGCVEYRYSTVFEYSRIPPHDPGSIIRIPSCLVGTSEGSEFLYPLRSPNL